MKFKGKFINSNILRIFLEFIFPLHTNNIKVDTFVKIHPKISDMAHNYRFTIWNTSNFSIFTSNINLLQKSHKINDVEIWKYREIFQFVQLQRL